LEQDRTLVELDALVRPMSDLGLYLAGADDRPAARRARHRPAEDHRHAGRADRRR
jgi:hypothetical protein